MKLLPTITTLMFLALFSQSINADAHPNLEAEQRLAQAQARLNLSDAQKEQMAPVMQQSMQQRKTILANYGIDLDNPEGSSRPGFRQARAMRSELQVAQADTISKLEGILTDEQLDEFKQMQEEQRAEMRERIRSGTSAQ